MANSAAENKIVTMRKIAKSMITKILDRWNDEGYPRRRHHSLDDLPVAPSPDSASTTHKLLKDLHYGVKMEEKIGSKKYYCISKVMLAALSYQGSNLDSEIVKLAKNALELAYSLAQYWFEELTEMEKWTGTSPFAEWYGPEKDCTDDGIFRASITLAFCAIIVKAPSSQSSSPNVCNTEGQPSSLALEDSSSIGHPILLPVDEVVKDGGRDHPLEQLLLATLRTRSGPVSITDMPVPWPLPEE